MHNVSREVTSSNCSCLGDTLTFECTVMGELGTVWSGSAFNCANSENEIFLLKNSLGLPNNIKTCNNGAISGQVTRSEDGFYISQLSVIISPNLIGKTINCTDHDKLGAVSPEVLESATINAITST